MKLNKSSIFALMTLGGLLAFGPVAGAQDQSSTNTPPPGAGRRGPPTPERMMGQLKLTDDQKEKVKPILMDRADKMKAVMQDQSLTPQERRPKMKEINDEATAKLKPILTDDQFAQWQKMSQPRRRGSGGGNPPANPPTTPPPSTGDKN